MKTIKTIEKSHKDIGFSHFQNTTNSIRNVHALANFERTGAGLISFQAKKIIHKQKKLMPKHYQNSYYFFGYGSYNYNSQATA
jgi:hypothetical protein